MPPRCPQRTLADPCSIFGQFVIARFLLVHHATMENEVHSWHGWLLMIHEQNVSGRDVEWLDCHVTDFAKAHRVDIIVLLEERMCRQCERVHLKVKFNAQWLRDHLEKIHAGLRHILLMLLHRVLCISLHTNLQALRDVVVGQIALQDGDLSRFLIGENLQPSHSSGDAAHER